MQSILMRYMKKLIIFWSCSLSFFVSKNIENLIDEKSYLSRESSTDSELLFTFLVEESVLFSKNKFQSIEYDNSKINLIDIIITKKELNLIFGKAKIKIEIKSKDQNEILLLKLIKITNIDNDSYCCQFKSEIGC